MGGSSAQIHGAAPLRRRAMKGDAASEALYSPCETYRYALTRMWQPEGRRLLYIMLNPSKATEAQNDPTIERCERRARALGFGGFRAVNLFALRETDPAQMRAHLAPEGPWNMQALREGADWADLVLCAWGVHGVHLGQGARVEAALRADGGDLWVLGLTKEGHPRHPLYLPYRAQPEPWAAG